MKMSGLILLLPVCERFAVRRGLRGAGELTGHGQ